MPVWDCCRLRHQGLHQRHQPSQVRSMLCKLNRPKAIPFAALLMNMDSKVHGLWHAERCK